MIDDVRELLSLGTSIREAVEGADAVKTKMRTRLKEYDSVLEALLQSDFADIKSELLRLRDLYEEIDALHVKHTAQPGDPRWAKVARIINRGTQHKSIEEDLDAIDKEAHQLFGIIATKSSIDIRKLINQTISLHHRLHAEELERERNLMWTQVVIAGGVFTALLGALMLSRRNETSPIDIGQVVGLVLQDLQLEGERITSTTQVSIVGAFGALVVVFSTVMWAQRKAFSAMIRGALPPKLPQRAAVPAGALALPRSYVERPGVQEAVYDLINPEKALAPYAIVGMGGGGKTVLASAVVREPSVREHFRGGIFWLRAGRGAMRSLLSLLQGLAREIGAAPADAPHGVPFVLGSLEQVNQHLATVVASTGTSQLLVVLDDVWEREVVDALLALRLKVLVTTRDRSVVGVPGGCLELGGMAEDEALELLLKTSGAADQPGKEVRAQMMKVMDVSWAVDMGVVRGMLCPWFVAWHFFSVSVPREAKRGTDWMLAAE